MGDEDDGFDENYFRRRPKSFCMQGDGRRYGSMDPGMRLSSTSLAEENYFRSIAMVRGGGLFYLIFLSTFLISYF